MFVAFCLLASLHAAIQLEDSYGSITYAFVEANPAAKLAHMKNGLINLAFLLAIPAACTTLPPPPPAPPRTAPGADFLARNATAKGVVTTHSGLQYFIIKSGPPTGRSPTAADSVVFDYEGKLTTGETFDSSYARGQPLSGGVADFVPGFTEALMLMRPGDEWIVWIPPALGYGDRATETIPANSVLRFRMSLRSVLPVAPAG